MFTGHGAKRSFAALRSQAELGNEGNRTDGCGTAAGTRINVMSDIRPPVSENRPGRLFAVISWGSAATRWLVAVLNRHPDIFALHNARNWINRCGGNLAVDSYLRIIEHQAAGLKLAGDAHGVPLEEAPALRAAWGERIRFASVVRHPIQRGISSQRFWTASSPAIDAAWYDEPSIRDVRSLLTSSTAVHFARAMHLAENIVRETALGPVFRMEDLTSDVAFVWKLIEHLSDGTVRRDAEIDRTLFLSGKVGVHGSSAAARDPYTEEPWQHELFERIVSDEGKRLYRELGYTISRPQGSVVFPPAGPLPPTPTPERPPSMPFLHRLKWAAKFLLNRLPDDGRFR